jgi:hypothetical protein
MQRNATASIVYLVTAAAGSLFVLSHSAIGGWLEASIIWLCVATTPLLFVFTYSRFLLVTPSPVSRTRLIGEFLFHCLGIVSATIAFTFFSPYWKNPVRDPGESIVLLLVPLAVVIVFLVAAVSLLFRSKSGFATPASILIWPYWFVLALVLEGYWYQDSGIYAVAHFLCFITPVFFAFAAGAALARPTAGHTAALLGVLAVPSVYLSLRDSGLGNVWVMFNQPDDRFASYPPYAVFGICFVALLIVSIATAVLRLLPSGWHLRRVPVSDRTWPAVLASLIFMIIWFCQSVMPYRIPGAVDYSAWPIFQILHVEKRGLQFHETRVSVSGRKVRSEYFPRSVQFSRNDRRLVNYRFLEKASTGQISDALSERVRTFLTSSNQPQPTWDPVKPIRNWNADNWYVIAEGAGLKAYTKENGSVPPPEIVNLFNDLEKLPQSSWSLSERKDVCLGFCYDPLSELGYLYANHRCFNDGHGVVCR